MVDIFEHLWPKIKDDYDPHTIVLNLDNGPENNSRRSMKRLVEFPNKYSVNISLAY